MKSVDEYRDECLALCEPLPAFSVGLAESFGCVLAQDVRARVDVPHADLAALDGYALVSHDVLTARQDDPVSLPVTGEIFASSTHSEVHTPGAAMKVASGARVPRGADSVVALQSTNQGDVAVDVYHRAEKGEHIRAHGEDMRSGDVVVRAGVRLSARHIAALAASGHDSVMVHPRPRVVIMSVGDELSEPGIPLGDGHIYDANGHALAAAVRALGGEVFRVSAVSDDARVLRDAIDDQLVRADVLITTGGLSFGGGDSLKDVLSPLGSVRFDNIAMTPGRQLGVGTVAGDCRIFCLPGDTVSAMIAFDVFVRPALRKMTGYKRVEAKTVNASASRAFPAHSGMRDYVLAKVSGNARDGYTCEALSDTAKPMLHDLAQANALAIVPEDVDAVAIGDTVRCEVLDL